MSAGRTFRSAEVGWISRVVIYPTAGFFCAQTPGGDWTLEEPSLCSRESLYREGSEHQDLLVAPAPDPCIALSGRTVCDFDWLKTDHNTARQPERRDKWEESNTILVYSRFTLGETVDSGFFWTSIWGKACALRPLRLVWNYIPTDGGRAGVITFAALLTCRVGPARTCFGRRTGWG